MINKFEKYISKNNLIKENDTIWVALSGGADSTCLLHLLISLKKKYNICIKAIHINHMIRKEEAIKDKKHCIMLCEKLNVELLLKDIDVIKYKKENKITLEQAGREIRYKEFEKLENKIALGHNKNDNVETIIMNIIRGSSSEGLKGIKNVTGKYIRPILDIYRYEIEEYCNINGLKYVIDSSNNDNKYFRNAIRNRVIPLLNEISNKDISKNILTLSKMIKEDSDFLNDITLKNYKEIVTNNEDRIIINNSNLIKCNDVISKRIIRMAINEVKGNLIDIEYSHTLDILYLCKENITGKKINIPGNISVLVQFGYTYVYLEKQLDKFNYVINVPGKTIIKDMNLSIKTKIIKTYKETKIDNNVHYFNYDMITNEICFRNKQVGDIIKPYKGNGTKKLKKYFIDKKIDRFKRNDLFLLAMGNNILYINGYDYGKDFLPKKNHSVLKVEFVGKEVI